MSNLVGRKSVEVPLEGLKGNAVPQWDSQNKCWKNVIIDSQIAAPFPFHFDFSNVISGQSKYIKIINDCRIEYELPGEAYCETLPSGEIEFEISYIRKGENPVPFGSVKFNNSSNFGEYEFINEQDALITFSNNPETSNDVIKVTAPLDLKGAQNISITIFGLVTLPVGRASAKFIFTGLDTLDVFETTFVTNSNANSPASAFQSFQVQALNLGEASENIVVSSFGGNLEFSADGNEFSDSMIISHKESGEILEAFTVYVRLKEGAFKIDDSYYKNEDIYSENVFEGLTDRILVQHENVITQGDKEIQYKVTVPSIVDNDSLSLLIDTKEETFFTIFGAGDLVNTVGTITYAKKEFPFNKVTANYSIGINSQTTVDLQGDSGIFIVQLQDGIGGINGYQSPDSQIIDVLRFGSAKTYRTNLSGFFRNCEGITKFTASDYEEFPTFSLNTNTTEFFHNAINFNDPYINEWDFSNVIEISGFFKGASLFNQKVDKWQFGENIISDQINGVFLDSGIDQLNADLSFIGWANYAISVDRNFLEQDFDVGITSTGDDKLESNVETYGLANPLLNGTLALTELSNRGLTVYSSNISPEIRLASNGVTILAGNADFGQQKVINGITYTVRDTVQQGDVDPINESNASTSVTSKVTNMSGLFQDKVLSDENFSIDITHWDVSNVTNMSNMFKNADFGAGYDKSLAVWDVSNVINFDNMFENSLGFNNDLTYWNVSHIEQAPLNFNTLSDLEDNFVPNWGDPYVALPLSIKGAKAAYSLRYVSPAYVGKPVIQITDGQNTYDLTMYDLLDNESLNNRLNNVVVSNSLKITIFYDQSGNDFHFENEFNTSPTIAIVNSSTNTYELLLEKGKAAIVFNGANNYLTSEESLYSNNLVSFLVATTEIDSNTYNHTLLYLPDSSEQSNYQILKTKNTSTQVTKDSIALIKTGDFGQRITFSDKSYLGNFLVTSMFKNDTSYQINIDGINVKETFSFNYDFKAGNNSKSSIGSIIDDEDSSNETYFSGKIQEILIYHEDPETLEIDSIESSISSYYILFDLDQFEQKVENSGGIIYVADEQIEAIKHHVKVYNEITQDSDTPFILCPCNGSSEGVLYNINPA